MLSVLLNHCNHRYATAGVNYIEYSVSYNDLLDEKIFEAITDGVYNANYFKTPKMVSKGSAKGRTSMTSAQTNLQNLHDVNSTAAAETKDNVADLTALSHPEEVGGSRPQHATQPERRIYLTTQFDVPDAERTLSPPWRKMAPYYRKSTGQSHRFLAAFARDKAGTNYLALGDDGLNFCNLPYNHREAYSSLSSITSKDNLPYLMNFIDTNIGSEGKDRKLLNSVNQLGFSELCGSGEICHVMQLFAKIVCDGDEWIQKIYPDFFTNNSAFAKLRNRIIPKKGQSLKEDDEKLMVAVVGLDWVGDELGHPFCAFQHSSVVDLVAEWMKYNPNFGVRIHAGEGPVRPSTMEPCDSPLRLAFYLHMYIVIEGIRSYFDKLEEKLTSMGMKNFEPNIRIGHGVAFLFNDRNLGSNEIDAAAIFLEYLREFRKFLRDKGIVCELNPTSNHMLLSSSFDGDNSNTRTLRKFLTERVPVCLGTDDDGIWSIPRCNLHNSHVSIAAEYCKAIECGDIQSEKELLKLRKWGRLGSFAEELEGRVDDIRKVVGPLQQAPSVQVMDGVSEEGDSEEEDE